MNAVFIVFLSAILSYPHESFAEELATKHKHVEHCLGSDGEGHPLNEFWYDDGMCQRFYCFRDDEGIIYEQITNCPIAIAEGDCKINPGTAGSYPDCCPTVICPDSPKAF
uniref:U-scoloptoxin(16)-Cw1a n=1 Tax=Cormocephalus westwoodi TaxID=1096223 RepID=TXG1A_CORWE|nr:RecName: Full=U-scoloptoxin(16)-Cw1a; Short=U-SLPTX(16)-Cw1a; Flags: Precursor [Cormocephalus westwoodi]